MPEGHDGRGPGGVSSNVGRGVANPTNVFLRSYKVYSPAFIGKPEVNRGNKSKFILTSPMSNVSCFLFSHPSHISTARVKSTSHSIPNDIYDL